MLAKIHNNPKFERPRIQLIIPQELEDKWLNPIEVELDVKSILIEAPVHGYSINSDIFAR